MNQSKCGLYPCEDFRSNFRALKSYGFQKFNKVAEPIRRNIKPSASPYASPTYLKQKKMEKESILSFLLRREKEHGVSVYGPPEIARLRMEIENLSKAILVLAKGTERPEQAFVKNLAQSLSEIAPSQKMEMEPDPITTPTTDSTTVLATDTEEQPSFPEPPPVPEPPPFKFTAGERQQSSTDYEWGFDENMKASTLIKYLESNPDENYSRNDIIQSPASEIRRLFVKFNRQRYTRGEKPMDGASRSFREVVIREHNKYLDDSYLTRTSVKREGGGTPSSSKKRKPNVVEDSAMSGDTSTSGSEIVGRNDFARSLNSLR